MHPKTVTVRPVVACRPGGPCWIAALPEGRTVTSWRARCEAGECVSGDGRARTDVEAHLCLCECARETHGFGGDGQHSLANVADGEQDVAPDAGRPPGFPERALICPPTGARRIGNWR